VPLSQADFGSVFDLVFVFRLGGPTPSEAAGGRPLTERSKRDGPARADRTTRDRDPEGEREAEPDDRFTRGRARDREPT